jgi:NAD(P)-dependent dehydrogenase (short-subunit alcohol dehydrogenase family)
MGSRSQACVAGAVTTRASIFGGSRGFEQKRNMQLEGRGVLITGGSQGLGKAVAKACLDAGADIYLCARDGIELAETCAEIRTSAGSAQRVLFQAGDVADPEFATTVVADACRELPRFSGVVNNAGIQGPKGRLEEVRWSEWTRTIEINLFGTALFCAAAIPGFRGQGYGKIVNLSGGGATAPMPGMSAYAASKAAVVRLTETLAQETAGSGIDVNAVAPGALNTRMLAEILDAGPEGVGQAHYERALKQQAGGGASLENASALCVYLLSAASDGITGRLVSAVWDPWPTLTARKAELAVTDIYTLRRIVPKDRGLDWGDA